MNWQNLAEYNITPLSLEIFAYTAVIHFIVMFALWWIGRGHKNDSILDIYWGFSFVVAVVNMVIIVYI